jgi:hypothetical protein
MQVDMRWIVVFLALALAACSTTTDLEPTQGELKAEWEAGNIAPTHYKDDLLAFLRTYLNDPNQIRDAAVGAPVRKRVLDNPAERYIVCVRYNARKSSGAYAGVKTGMAIFVSGRLDHFADMPRLVKEPCEGTAYQPFPELERLRR